MPLTTQRRNTAYLNRQISRLGQLDREIEGQALSPGRDLRLISGARSSSAPDSPAVVLPTWTNRAPCLRRLDRRDRGSRSLSLDLCVLTVELSGAHAGV